MFNDPLWREKHLNYFSGTEFMDFFLICINSFHSSIPEFDVNKTSQECSGWQQQNLHGKWALWHDDVIKWKHFPRYWPFVRGIHRSTVDSPHKGQWRGALMFSLMCAWINRWVNNGEAGDLRRHLAHYDDTVMLLQWHNMSVMASQITGNFTVCPEGCSG